MMSPEVLLLALEECEYLLAKQQQAERFAELQAAHQKRVAADFLGAVLSSLSMSSERALPDVIENLRIPDHG